MAVAPVTVCGNEVLSRLLSSLHLPKTGAACATKEGFDFEIEYMVRHRHLPPHGCVALVALVVVPFSSLDGKGGVFWECVVLLVAGC